uniref:Uncharacterized protein n=1 Tax=Picea sitchensis TaxID=3332 RepID=A9NM74_PICSI|nr:unknown [Picea sitchensis]
MVGSLGGPLLCVRDLLADLSRDDDDDYADSHPGPTSTTSQPQEPSECLHAIFERNYNDLIKALTNSGHSWTGLTLKLCTGLKAADMLVQSIHVKFGELSKKVEALEAVLKRGESALSKIPTGKIINERASIRN